MEQGRTPPSSSRARWRLLLSPPAGGVENMATDQALLDRARATGECVMRVYEWAAPTLSLGRNQTAQGRYDVDRARSLGVEFVRRPTGGRAVLHDRELTYSVTGPTAALGSLRESYGRINRLLRSALARLGVEATVAGAADRSQSPGVAPCFDVPSEGELVVGELKLVGSAQWREDDALLQHGSILVDGDQALASSLLRTPPRPPPMPATLRSILGRTPPAAELFHALKCAIVTFEDLEVSHLDPDEALRSGIRDAKSHYSDEHWTWRR
jgi:lipoate-protein ligase A